MAKLQYTTSFRNTGELKLKVALEEQVIPPAKRSDTFPYIEIKQSLAESAFGKCVIHSCCMAQRSVWRNSTREKISVFRMAK